MKKNNVKYYYQEETHEYVEHYACITDKGDYILRPHYKVCEKTEKSIKDRDYIRKVPVKYLILQGIPVYEK